MKRILYILIPIITMSSCELQEKISEQEVINALKKFDEGWEKKNMQNVDDVLSPTYIYFTQSGNTFSRDSVVATAGESNYALKNMSRSEIKVTITGNTAIVSTRWKGEGSYKDRPFNEDQRCSLVLIKENNKVSILSEHCTPIKPAKVFH